MTFQIHCAIFAVNKYSRMERVAFSYEDSIVLSNCTAVHLPRVINPPVLNQGDELPAVGLAGTSGRVTDPPFLERMS